MNKKNPKIEKQRDLEPSAFEKKDIPLKHSAEPESVPMKVWRDENGDLKVTYDPNALEHPINKVMGCEGLELSSETFLAAYTAISKTISTHENAMNVIIQSLHDFKPRDAIEARLAAQATVLFHYAMNSISRCGDADMLPHIESMGNLAIKLMRVHNETIETLNRYKRGGEQKVIVQHINADKAVVNQFNDNQFMGGGGLSESKGDNPCSS